MVMAGSHVQAFLLLTAWGHVAAQVSNGAVLSSGPYVRGQTPAFLKFSFQVGTQAATVGDTVVITASAAIFGADETGITEGDGIAVSASSPFPNPSLTYALSNSGTTLTGTLSGTSFDTGGATYTITVDGKLTSLPTLSTAMSQAPAVSCSIVVSGNAVQTDIFAVTATVEPTVVLTPASYDVGDQPTKLEITIIMPVATANTQTLTITPSMTLFTGSATSDVTIVTPHAGSPTVTAFTATNIVVTSGGASLSGDTLKLEVATAGLTTLPSLTSVTSQAVTFDVVHSLDTNKLVDGAALFTIVDPNAGSGSSAGDPVTWYGNLRTEYHLPLDELVLLFEAPDFQILGKAFEGYNTDQWIKEIITKSRHGKTIANVSIKPDLVTWNINRTAPNLFDTLDVTLWDTPRTRLLDFFPPADAYVYHDQVTLMFVRPDLDRHPRAYMPRRECAMIASASAKVMVCSASAHEWFGELGRGGFQHAHLDLEFFDLQLQHHTYTGALPEMWGIAPMSPTTRSFIVSESGEHPPTGTVTRAYVDANVSCAKPVLSDPKHNITTVV